MPGLTITKRAVDACQPGKADCYLWDDGVKGFGLKVTPSGGKSYVFQYRIARPGAADRTAPKRITLGRHGALTPEQARQRARELAAMVAAGHDPKELKREKHTARDRALLEVEQRERIERDLAFDAYAARWLADYEHEKERRPSSVRLARGVVANHLAPAWKDKPMPNIGRADVQRVLDTIPPKQKAMRRAVYAYASVLFGWAVKRGDLTANPVVAMAKPEAPKARDRVLTDAELVRIWRASEGGSVFGAFYRLLILTAQRREEVAGLEWRELDRADAVWTIPADRAKNGVAHIVPLSAAALAELDRLSDGREWPTRGPVLTTNGLTSVSGFAKAKSALDRAIAAAGDRGALSAWRVHDIRRTVATGFQRIGVRFEVTEALLNHVSGARGGVAGIYQRHDWKDEKRAALDAWARRLGEMLTPARDGCNVVAIGGAQRAA